MVIDDSSTDVGPVDVRSHVLTAVAITLGLLSFAMGISPIATTWNPYLVVFTIMFAFVGLIGSTSIAVLRHHAPTRAAVVWWAIFEGLVASGVFAVGFAIVLNWQAALAPPDFCEGAGCVTTAGWGFPVTFALAAASTVAFSVFAFRSFRKVRGAAAELRAFGLTRGALRALEAVCCLVPFIGLVVPIPGF